ncbi:MAG: hypothetical protein HY721_13570 [Planctomycetes bacterium]|nr:hypothetical protein [Planctomycetota bacterium]
MRSSTDMFSRRWGAGLLLALFAACLHPGEARGGNVFMKNGYIIQGPIVERSDASIVLGWSYGKVTIHRRFIDSVIYDLVEERRLKEDELHREQVAAEPAEGTTLLETSQGDVEDLPPDPDAFIRSYLPSVKSDPVAPQPGGAADAGGAGGAPVANPSEAASGGSGGPGPSPGGVVSVVPRPEDLLGDAVRDDRLAISLRPPKGWTVARNASAFQVVGSAASGGFQPSINVVSMLRGPLGGEDYIGLLKEETARALKDYELLGEGPRSLGAHKAYELVWRGAANDRTATARQLLLVGGDMLWLVSAFAPSQGGESVAAAIEESLKTFEIAAP